VLGSCDPEFTLDSDCLGEQCTVGRVVRLELGETEPVRESGNLIEGVCVSLHLG
jgi:hypothetical protein